MLASRLVDAERLLVAAREDRGRRAGEFEQLDGAGEAALVLEVAVPDEQRVDGVIPTFKVSDSSLRGGVADEAIQSPRRGLWIASLRSQ